MWKPAIAITALLLASHANADLRYSVREISGNRAILVSGSFEEKDDVDTLVQMATSGARVVTFDSDGGNLAKAFEMGRTIRKLGLVTLQTRLHGCVSACAFAYMGGAFRMADPGSIGIHKLAFEDGAISAGRAASGTQDAISLMFDYLAEMGIDPGIVPLMLQYDADDMRYLSKSEMAKFHVTSLTSEQAAQVYREMQPDNEFFDLEIFHIPVPQPRPVIEGSRVFPQ